jgi:hypothetical protein
VAFHLSHSLRTVNPVTAKAWWRCHLTISSPKCRRGSYGVGKSSPKRRPVLAMITIRAGKLEPLDVRGEALRYCCSRLSEVLWSIPMCPVLASRVML